MAFASTSAHAGYAPWEGVNALDAAFVAYAGISALRQQIRPEQRVHGVISGRDWTSNGSFLIYFLLSKKKKGDIFIYTYKYYIRNFAHAILVIPDYAKMTWSVRADAWAALEPLRERVVSCLG